MRTSPTHRPARGGVKALAVLAAVASSAPAGADDGNLTHRLDADQRRSSLEQKLEHVRERARAARNRDDSSFTVERPKAPPGYHGSQRLRLTPRPPDAADAPDAAPGRAADDDAEDVAERRQRQLHQGQHRRALHSGTSRAGRRPGREDFETRQEQRKFRREQRSEAFHRKLMR